MSDEPSQEEIALDTLVQALTATGWEFEQEIPDFINHQLASMVSNGSLPDHYTPFLLYIRTAPPILDLGKHNKKFAEFVESASLASPLGLTVNIKGVDPATILAGNMEWRFSHRELPRASVTFSASVVELADRIFDEGIKFEKQLMENDRASKRKKARPRAVKSEAEVEEKKVKDQIDVEVGEATESPPLPFELVPGADPNDADIIIVPVSEDGLLSGEAKSILEAIAYKGPRPEFDETALIYQIVEGAWSDKLVLFVVTRRPRGRFAELLDKNLPKALAQLSSGNRFGGKIVYVPLLRTGTGAIGVEAGLEVTMGAFRQALTDPNAYPARITIDPPGGMTDEDLNQLRSRLPQDSSREYGAVRSPADASVDVGLSDAASGEPGLDFPDIARSFRQFVDEMVAERSGKTSEGALITIGIFGRWGTGKSTMIKALWKAFEDRYTQIMVNAWKWDGKKDVHDFFHDTFLKELRNQHKALYWKYIREREKLRLARILVALAAVGLFALGAYWAFWFAADQGWISINSTEPDEILKFGVSSVVVLILGMAYYDFVFKPVRAHFAKFIERQLLLKDVEELGREGLVRTYRRIAALKGMQKDSDGKILALPFIFYIDDLDRCAPDRVATFIQSIHSLTATGCVTFVACDEAYVSSALQSHFKEVAEYHPEKEDFGRNFLDKIIQVPFRVPALDNKRLGDLGLTRKRVTKFKAHEKAAPDSDEKIKKSKSADPPTAPTDPAAAGETDVSGGMGEKPGAAEGAQEKPIPLLPDSYRKGIKARAKKCSRELGVGSPEDKETVYAFCFADRYLPDWLDKYQLAEVDTIPEGAPGGLSAATREEIVAALDRNPEIFKRLVEKRLVRISEVLNEVLGPFTLPLRLAPRDVKSLTNQLHIYLRIKPFEEFEEAKVAAAYLLADRLDPLWLDHHMGISSHIPVNEHGRIARAEDGPKKALKKMIDKQKVKELGLRRWRASA